MYLLVQYIYHSIHKHTHKDTHTISLPGYDPEVLWRGVHLEAGAHGVSLSAASLAVG